MNILIIYCQIDDFNKNFENGLKKKLIAENEEKKESNSRLSKSEIMAILVYFHLYGYRTFKWFYVNYVCVHMKSDFPDLVSYNRFVELMQSVLINLSAFLRYNRMGKATGISFIDSTSIKVCGNKRIKNNKVFQGIATTGKTTMGWFHGFKLHLVINDKGEIIAFTLTPGNVDDRNEDVMTVLTQNLFGKLFGDKGYISQKLFDELFAKDIHLITSVKKNMKNKLLSLFDKLLLRKRSLIETVNDQLKNISQIEHTRHRSPVNFLVNIISSLIAYSYREKKPCLHFDNVNMNELVLI